MKLLKDMKTDVNILKNMEDVFMNNKEMIVYNLCDGKIINKFKYSEIDGLSLGDVFLRIKCRDLVFSYNRNTTGFSYR